MTMIVHITRKIFFSSAGKKWRRIIVHVQKASESSPDVLVMSVGSPHLAASHVSAKYLRRYSLQTIAITMTVLGTIYIGQNNDNNNSVVVFLLMLTCILYAKACETSSKIDQLVAMDSFVYSLLVAIHQRSLKIETGVAYFSNSVLYQ